MQKNNDLESYKIFPAVWKIILPLEPSTKSYFLALLIKEKNNKFMLKGMVPNKRAPICITRGTVNIVIITAMTFKKIQF